jgi:hypothetical protein
MQSLLQAVSGSQATMDQFVSMMAGTLSPPEFFAPENVGRILGHGPRETERAAAHP